MRLPTSFRLALPAAALALAALAALAAAQTDARTPNGVFRVEQQFQPPSVRLQAMGGLVLCVPDGYNDLDLWDFAGLPIDLAADRDSTRIDAWADRASSVLDRKIGGIEREQSRGRDFTLGGEGILRTGKFAVGLDASRVGMTAGLPFGPGTHLTEDVSQPTLRPMAGGPLWRSVWWGLSAAFGSGSRHERWYADEPSGGRVRLDKDAEQLLAPDLFSADRLNTTYRSLGGSLGLRRPQGTAALFYDRSWEKYDTDLRALRSVYETEQPHDWTGFGAAVHARVGAPLQIAALAGRRYRSDIETYRFSLSGGSTSDPLAVRGDRANVNEREDYTRVRLLADGRAVGGLPITLGAEVHTDYQRSAQSPRGTRWNDFNNFVLGIAAGDTLVAPAVVLDQEHRSRVIGVGGGASYGGGPLIVGAEVHWERNAYIGTLLLGRSRTWDVRAGGEYRLDARWSLLAGWRHQRSDPDVFTARNEMLTDRASAGFEARRLKGWQLRGSVTRDWVRTDYPDPGELGGSGLGILVNLAREF